MQKHERIFIATKERTNLKVFTQEESTPLFADRTNTFLKEREGVIVFTPEELKSLILDWNYGHEKGGINEFLKEKGLL